MVLSRNILHGRGVGSKSRIRVTRPRGSSCAQSACEKYELIRGTAKKALLKHLLVTAPRYANCYVFVGFLEVTEQSCFLQQNAETP